MPFVKLNCGILDSTLWIDRVARDLFITALLMAEPYEVQAPLPQLEVDALKPTGWRVPPGWYGFVPASGPGIIHRAGFDGDFKQAVEALRRLGKAEPESRSQAHAGRRMVRVDGGYLILNFIEYRERDTTNAERQKRWRTRHVVTPLRDAVTPLRNGDSNQAEYRVQSTEVRTERAVASPQHSFKIIRKLAHDVLDSGQFEDEGEFADALKDACARHGIPYDSQVVRKAVESVQHTRRRS